MRPGSASGQDEDYVERIRPWNQVEEFCHQRKHIETLSPSAVSTRYLGVTFYFLDTHAVELPNQISKAWRKSGLFRDELTNKFFPVAKRLKPFKLVVQPTVLYECMS